MRHRSHRIRHGNTVTGLRPDSDLEIAEGMTFHVLSWLMETGRGDGFFSNTVLVGPRAAEVLTSTARDRPALAD
jgi:Xaa-Pro dipeptidase